MAVGEINSHYERAYRLSLHTIVLLAGTNLMPLIGAAIIQGLGWQWVFWISAIFGAIGGVLLLLAAPETLQDRTSEPRDENNTSVMDAGPLTRCVNKFGTMEKGKACRDSRPTSQSNCTNIPELTITTADTVDKRTIAERRGLRAVGFVQEPEKVPTLNDDPMARILIDHTDSPDGNQPKSAIGEIYGARTPKTAKDFSRNLSSGCDEDDHITGRDAQQRRPSTHRDSWRIQPEGQGPQTPELHNFNSPSYLQPEFSTSHGNKQDTSLSQNTDLEAQTPATVSLYSTRKDSYTQTHLNAKPETFLKSMKPWNERISQEDWIRLSVRPFLLFAYPSIIWSSLVYALSIGWLIVLSETVTVVYSSRDSYNFSVLQCGLVYLSPFVGGILGIVVAAKSSDLIAGWMTKRNNGLYEPKFRLVMAIPILISTVIGLMGFGWAAQEKDPWILPTIFFGIISFGSSFGATTAITFAVDSYPQNTAEALVSLNFSKSKHPIPH